MTKPEELEKEIRELTLKYKCRLFYVAVAEDGTVSYCGNLCPCCAFEALEWYIMDKNIRHENDEIEKEEIH